MDASTRLHSSKFSQESEFLEDSSDSWSYADQLPDLNNSAAVALAFANQAHDAQVSYQTVESQALTFGNPTERCIQMPYKSLPDHTNAVVASKVASFTPVTFTQINDNQELSVPPNPLLLNGKVSGNPVLCNGSKRMTPEPRYGYPVSVLPNLNSLPEKTISMDLSKAIPPPSDAVVASKLASVTPLMFAQISSSQELSVPPNQLLLNGKVSLNPVLYNGSECLALKPQR